MGGIRIDLQADGLDGPTGVAGRLTVIASGPHGEGDDLILPAPLRFELAGTGPTTCDGLDPTDDEFFYWAIVTQGGRVWMRSVALADEVTDWGDLTDVDPATFSPVAEPANLGQAITAAIEAQVPPLITAALDGIEVGTSPQQLATALADYATLAALGAKYTKPGSGIPSTDLDADAQAALALAGTAVQPTALTFAPRGANNDVGPLGHGGIAWTDDPAIGGASVALPAGRIYASRFRAAASGEVLTAAFGINNTGGTAVTYAGLAIYDLAGNRIGLSNAETTLLQSSGDKAFTFAEGSRPTLVAGVEYVAAYLVLASVAPTLNCTIASSRPNLGMPSSVGMANNPLRHGATATGRTDLPATLNWVSFSIIANTPTFVLRA